MYLGNNKCFAGNTIATYGGGDCALYCPNTNIVSSSNFSALFRSDLVTYAYHIPPEEIELSGSKTWNSVQSIYLDDDDEEIGWWFNMNPGSSVNMTFDLWMDTDEVYMQIDDEDVGYTVQNGTYNFVTEEIKDDLYSRGYKISFKTDNPMVNGTIGTVDFAYTETLYSTAKASTNQTCLNFNLLRGCVYEYDYGDDFCIVQYNNYEERNWGHDYSPYCTSVNQTGRDKAFAGFLIPVSTAIVMIIIAFNITVSWIISKRAAHLADKNEDVTLSSVDKFDSFKENI